MRYRSKRYRSKPGSRAGFTLLELLLVLAMAGMIMWAGALSFARLGEKTAFKSALRAVHGGLRQARVLALSERRPVGFKAEGDSFHLTLNGEPHGRKYAMPKKTAVKAEEEIIFYPKGHSSGGTVLVISPEGKKYSIEVDGVTGFAKLKED